MQWLRRCLVLGLVGGVGAAGFRLWQQRRPIAGPQVAPPEWPKFAATPPTTFHPVTFHQVAGPLDDHEVAAEPATWLAPLDGECPDGYPIKANDNSGIFHVPGGRFYARTVPERCYANSADAVRDGYRPAKA